MANVSFDDLDTFDTETRIAKHDHKVVAPFTNPCPKCRGTGRFRNLGPCFMCKGKGELSFKTDAHTRAKGRAAYHAGKVHKAEKALKTFAELNPEMWAWIERTAPRFEFAASMKEAIKKFGHLTPGQMAAVERCMARDVVRMAERAERAAEARGIDVSRIVDLFKTARSNKLKRPTLRVGSVVLSLAGEGSKNPGCVYVKDGETYLGKITPDGIYAPSRAATAEHIETVKATAADPLGLAVAYGKRTGNCACCGHFLHNRISVELGIGPICRAKWGM